MDIPKPVPFLVGGLLAWGTVILAGALAGHPAIILGGVLGAWIFGCLTAVLTLDHEPAAGAPSGTGRDGGRQQPGRWRAAVSWRAVRRGA